MKLNDLDGHMSDSHSFKIISKILNGGNPSIITNKDRQMVIKAETIRSINKEFENGLIAEANVYKKYMYPEDLVLFLVLAHESNLMDYAIQILETVKYDGRLMSLSDLTGALAQSGELPAEWSAGLFGEIGDERFEKPTRGSKMPSTLDLSRLKIDF